MILDTLAWAILIVFLLAILLSMVSMYGIKDLLYFMLKISIMLFIVISVIWAIFRILG